MSCKIDKDPKELSQIDRRDIYAYKGRRELISKLVSC